MIRKECPNFLFEGQFLILMIQLIHMEHVYKYITNSINHQNNINLKL